MGGVVWPGKMLTSMEFKMRDEDAWIIVISMRWQGTPLLNQNGTGHYLKRF